MRRNIELYIGGQRVDLNDNSFILFNYTLEDLSNPTAVKNSFSKSITLPGTSNNNSLFGHMYRVDRITQYGGYIGADFDAMRRIPFEIYDEKSEIIESGYAKLEKVQLNGMEKEYQVTLYGNLGLFFYGLTSKEDGTPMTLADLAFENIAGNITGEDEFLVYDGAKAVSDCWKYLADPEGYNYSIGVRWANIISFAPAYNGIPSKGFKADRTLRDDYLNIPTSRTIDGVLYSRKSNASSNMTLFSNPHSEWELKELRWYLQRPIVSIKAIFDAICMPENNGGFVVELDNSFFNSNNHLYWDGWLTLPMLSIEKRNDEDILVKALQSSLSPAEYLISFAKMTGLVFVIDRATKKVTIKQRSKFFSQDSIIDLTDRVDQQSISITPHLSESRVYEFGNKNVGEWASTYRERFGKEYGIQRVNTGNEFSNETKVTTEGIKFVDAVEVTESNLMYYSDCAVPPPSGTSFIGKYFRLPLFESVKTQLWNATSNTMKEVDVEFNQPEGSVIYADNKSFPNADWLPKVQLHEADNKEIDGANVLLIFNGVKSVPTYVRFSSGIDFRAEYQLTKDNADMDLLNEGVPCWGGDVYETLQTLPSFRRSFYNGTYITEICEWGLSEERAVISFPSLSKNITLYERFWKKFQADRYDDDTMVMACKVDLRGLNVEQSLLGKFFFYQGAIFVLNRITNHSLTTYDDTECEFIRVQNINNYIE